MSFIHFTCETLVKGNIDSIFTGILNLENWSSFKGYGPLPGIRKAEFAVKPQEIIGTVFRVENTDGSCHTETIKEWIPRKSIVIEISNFSPPLSKFSTHFIETWSFTPSHTGYLMRREFNLYAKNNFALFFLWLISKLMKRAVDHHSRFIIQQTQSEVT